MRQDVIGSSFPHRISIPFHEAGHIIFSPFGDVVMALGGSLMQILIPAICLLTFTTTSPNPFGATAMTWWAGQNLMDIALYIGDARALQLVLLGGATGAEVEGHDWERILNAWGLLHHDRQIAGLVQFIGATVMLVALVWGSLVTLRSRTERP